MNNEPLDAARIETLAIETLQRVRGDKKVLAAKGDLGFDLQIVPGGAKDGTYGTVLTVQLFVWDAHGVRDIKEQEIALVPAGVEDERVPAYLEGAALAFRDRVERSPEVETLMPYDFFPSRAFTDPTRRTPQELAAWIAEQVAPKDIGALDDLSGTEPIAVNRELEEAIEQDPERVENHLVYGDWLSEKGDPRGEVITCSAPDAPLAAKRRAFAVLAQNERYFSGNLVANPDYDQYIELEWELGWIAGARLSAEYDLTQTTPDFVEKALRGLLGLPSAKFIKRLTLGIFNFEGDNNYSTLYPILVAAGPRPTLRKLFIGDTNSEQQEISWTSAGDLRQLRGLYPALRELKVRAGTMNVEDALDYQHLESFVVESGGMSEESVRAIGNTPFPALRRLELWLGTPGYGGSSNVEHLAPLLQGARLPKLEALGLKNCAYTDDICRELGAAPIVEQVRALDLSMGVMTDAGVQALLECRERFAHLRRLDVSQSYLTDAGIEALRGLGPSLELEARDQRRSDDGERYVSVSE
jgi:uncharacterized protein (TIGR02996 family)